MFRLSLLLLALPLFPLSAEEPLPPPYNTLKVREPHYHGWFNCAAQLGPIFESNQIETVVEVGSWMGNSTAWMAKKVSEGGKVYAVDHWLGSSEHQEGQYAHHESLPKLYSQFLSNMVHQGVATQVVPVRMESGEAAASLDVRPDLIYLDASHEYPLVLRDLELWYPALAEDGIMCGDDYNWPSVARAVQEFAAKNHLRVESQGAFWRLHTAEVAGPESL